MDCNSSSSSLILLAFLLLHCFQIVSLGVGASTELYIVYLGEKQHDDPLLVTASHHDMLTSLLGSKEEALNSIVYSYKHGFSGFAAMLTHSQAQQIQEFPEVISIKQNQVYRGHTTRSWDFLGLDYSRHESLVRKANYGEDIIIGVVDSGIWPESKSFDDRGYSPVPSRWKGRCQAAESFGSNNCSRKIIGARWYTGGIDPTYLEGEYMSARDFNGHGTHTASTAAGGLVRDASYHGLADGAARGGAPRARLAIYKACWGAGVNCAAADLLAAIDDAINDGVDVLSLSLGGTGEIAGTLHAVAKGITVVFSAGNDGPAPQSMQNSVPWVITVAASTIDRSFPTTITLGNNKKLAGQSIFYRTNSSSSNYTDLVYGSSCDSNDLNGTNIADKIVLCYAPTLVSSTLPISSLPDALDNVLNAGGAGLIFAQYTVNVLEFLLQCQGIPCVVVDFEIAKQIHNYWSTESVPMVKVDPTRNVVGDEVVAPKVAAFSSRGPSASFPGVLKPDVAAPGVSILAATFDSYGFKSGTSMACPHVSGVAALLKSLHPEWSPAAIKSAIVTTASIYDANGLPINAEATPRKIADPFDFGGGHIDPNRAADPGLVYDINPEDYTKFFRCNLGTSEACDTSVGPLYYLNLPSIAIPDLKTTVSVWRAVTNVGPVNATYKAVLEPPPGVEMAVKPSVLVFDAGRRTQSFMVALTAIHRVQGDYRFGSLTWSDDAKHSVRIPIATRTVIQDLYSNTS